MLISRLPIVVNRKALRAQRPALVASLGTYYHNFAVSSVFKTSLDYRIAWTTWRKGVLRWTWPSESQATLIVR